MTERVVGILVVETRLFMAYI